MNALLIDGLGGHSRSRRDSEAWRVPAAGRGAYRGLRSTPPGVTARLAPPSAAGGRFQYLAEGLAHRVGGGGLLLDGGLVLLMRLLPVALAAHLLPGAAALDNGRALTPPAGWTAWNVYVFHPTQLLVEASMRALARPRGPQNRSLVDLGYLQANLDDAWQACGAGVNRSFHDAAGNPLWNERAFPNVSAMTELGASLGIEPGLYMNNCQCSENMFTDPAQIAAIVRRSAAAVARLGFLSLKLDSCGKLPSYRCHPGCILPQDGSDIVAAYRSCPA